MTIKRDNQKTHVITPEEMRKGVLYSIPDGGSYRLIRKGKNGVIESFAPHENPLPWRMPKCGVIEDE